MSVSAITSATIVKNTNSPWINFFNPMYVWTDGTDSYYSNGSTHRVFDKTSKTWVTKTWNGLTGFYGYNVWTDGTNIYYSNGTEQYVLNKSTSTWEQKTWNGLPSSGLNGRYIWTDGTDIYYSYCKTLADATVSSEDVYLVLNKSTSTWEEKAWELDQTGYNTGIKFNGNYVINMFGYTYIEGTTQIGSTLFDSVIFTLVNGKWKMLSQSPFKYISYIWKFKDEYYYSNGDGIVYKIICRSQTSLSSQEIVLSCVPNTSGTMPTAYEHMVNFKGNNVWVYNDEEVYITGFDGTYNTALKLINSKYSINIDSNSTDVLSLTLGNPGIGTIIRIADSSATDPAPNVRSNYAVIRKNQTSYKINSIKVNGVTITGTSFIMPAEDATVSAEFEKLYSVTADTVSHGTISVSSANAVEGDLIGVTVTPDSGYKLKAIKVNGTAISGTSFAMPAEDATVSAEFEKLYSVTADTVSHGSVSVSSVNGVEGDLIGITAIPDSGYKLKAIKVNGTAITGTSFTMPAEDVTVSAEFEQLFTVTTDTVSHGSVSVVSEAKANEVIGVVATPDSGYKLKAIKVNGTAITGTSFTMPAEDVTVSAEFIENVPTDIDNRYLNMQGVAKVISLAKTGHMQIFTGTQAEWDALSDSEKAQYDIAEVVN